MAEHTLDVTLNAVPLYSLAQFQNRLPLIKEVRIDNASGEALLRPLVRITANPACILPLELECADIAGHDSLVLDASSFRPVADVEYFKSLAECEMGSVRVEVFGGDNRETPVATAACPVEFLPADFWPGGQFAHELLATFVTPNSPAVVTLMRDAADRLRRDTGDSSLSGYQSHDRGRVLQVVKAIYDTVRERTLSYAEAPKAHSGFGGQRVRLPERILETGFACCLDYALLFAAMMEHASLRPVVIVLGDHAFVGVFLTDDDTFATAEIESQQAVRKRLELDNFVALEGTAASDGRRGFKACCDDARATLFADHDLFYAIDIVQARIAGYRALNLADGSDAACEAAPAAAAAKDVEGDGLPALHADSEPPVVPGDAPNVPPRVAAWRSKLLDLSRRNRLLNFKGNAQALELCSVPPAELEDMLSDGSRFSFEGFDDGAMARLRAQGVTFDDRAHFAPEAAALFAKRKFLVLMQRKPLERRLVELFRTMRTDIEESGVNTLYIVLGTLEWKDSAAGGKTYRAPLLLVPVTLARATAASGFTLQRSDDEPAVNVTLLELMRREFGIAVEGVDPPPQDESGLNVEFIFRKFREAVEHREGWEVRSDDIWLARLSFSKFLMWDDLGRQLDKLRENPVVEHLVSGGASFSDGLEMVRPDEVDTCVPPEELFCPMSADSSQLAAVISAAKGKSFVLHGPPGTGKSQTIANLIAYCLAAGKSVLFVAEKRAALEVVQRRLGKLGLAPFCLELHSNKAGKAEVLRQFEEALNVAASEAPAEWEALSKSLVETRERLSSYVAALHRTHPCGVTPYEAFSYLFTHEGDKEEFAAVPPLDGVSLSEPLLDSLCDAARTLASRAQDLSPDAMAALRPISPAQWTPAWQTSLLDAAESLLSATDALESAAEPFAVAFSLPVAESMTLPQLEGVDALVEALRTCPPMPRGLFSDTWPATSAKLARAAEAGRAVNAAKASLPWVRLLSPEAMSFDVDAARASLRTAKRKFFLVRPFAVRGALKRMSAALGVERPAKVTSANAAAVLSAVETVQAESKRALADAAAFAPLLGASRWRDLETDWTALERLRSDGDALYAAVARCRAAGTSQLSSLCGRVADVAACAPEGRPFSAEQCGEWKAARASFDAASAAFAELASPRGADEWAGVGDGAEGVVPLRKAAANAVLDYERDLRHWCLWTPVRARFAELGAGGALDAIELGVLEPGRVAAALRLRYFERFVDDVISGDAVLREFTASTQDAAVAAFAELDGRIATAARGIILAKLAARLPAGRMSENCPAASELGILRRECAKKSRHKPVRALLESLPTLFPALKPCLLMSPLSVAQYLPPGTKPFDVVVFDEASQITVWDAIGAMARGRQCVVVGDPKQLPPTTFFQRQADGEEDIAECDIAELESILDECIAAGVSQSYLRWHYRSRHESLIAFSNHNYYGDRLRTFPSADQSTAAMGVSFVHVADGVYDRCRTRTNRREAEAVVEAVVRRMLDPAFRSKSAGVVTFSQAQQNLIEDLVDAQRRLHPEIECFFDSGADEPFFVKNLENVQGDERDALFFSIGYGPDADGKVAMNFGPLNRVGGERRLNVAVTRAKEQVVVFSSLLPEQVDLGRTQAVGAKHLKAFLEFAQGSGAASELRPCGAVAQGDSAELVDEIAQTLRMRGYAVDVRIGYSGLKIDIGVRADAESAKYVLGIECDGGAYRDGASVRDRDFLRRSVLEGLGWRMTRVWSAAWWHDREATERMLLTEVEAAVRGEPSPRACAARPAVSPAAPSRRAGRTRDARAAAAGEAFEKFEVPSVPGRGSRRPDDFCLPKAATKVRPYLEQLIARAAPLTGGYLRKRVRADWGIQRGGSAFEEVLAAAMPPGVRRTEQFGEAVYWRQEDDPAAFDRFRVPDGDSRRAIDEIPVEELAAAMRYLRRTFGELPEDSLFSETARLFGLPRVTPAARPRYAEAARRL